MLSKVFRLTKFLLTSFLEESHGSRSKFFRGSRTGILTSFSSHNGETLCLINDFLLYILLCSVKLRADV